MVDNNRFLFYISHAFVGIFLGRRTKRNVYRLRSTYMKGRKSTWITCEDPAFVGHEITDADVLMFADQFEALLVFPVNEPKTPFLLCTVGLVGSGKTTIMSALKEHLPGVYLRTDDMRRFLADQGYQTARTSEIAEVIIERLVKKGHSVLVDADCAADYWREPAEALAQYGVGIFWVHVVTSEAVILDRLRDDNPDREYKGEAARENYENRKVLHEHLSHPFYFTFHGDEPLEPQITAFLKQWPTLLSSAQTSALTN